MLDMIIVVLHIVGIICFVIAGKREGEENINGPLL